MKTTHQIAAELLSRIQDYLAKGGLFNPELMDAGKVQQLIMDCRTFIVRASRACERCPICGEISNLTKEQLANEIKIGSMVAEAKATHTSEKPMTVSEIYNAGKEWERAHASEPTYCKCDEINGDNPACPIHKTWTIETVGMIIGNVPVGDAAEAIAKAHNATHANEK